MRARPDQVDCRTCGVCCVGNAYDETFIDLLPEEAARFPVRWVIYDRNGYAALATRGRTGRCIALRGSVGCAVECQVYEERPNVCRNALQPGDKLCRQIRRENELTLLQSEPREAVRRDGP